METTKDVIDTALSFIDEGALVNLARELVSIPSYHGLDNPEKEISSFLQFLLKSEGLNPARIETEEGRYNVIAGYGKKNNLEKTLMLNGHLDTVSVENMTADPFSGKIIDGKIFGRGSVDMKSALASMIHAILAVKRAGISLEGEVVFAGVSDEEF